MDYDHDAHQQLLQRSMHRVHIPACAAGRGSQGRKPCPCPETCQDEPTGWTGYIAITAAAIACAVVAVLYQMGPL